MIITSKKCPWKIFRSCLNNESSLKILWIFFPNSVHSTIYSYYVKQITKKDAIQTLYFTDNTILLVLFIVCITAKFLYVPISNAWYENVTVMHWRWNSSTAKKMFVLLLFLECWKFLLNVWGIEQQISSRFIRQLDKCN